MDTELRFTIKPSKNLLTELLRKVIEDGDIHVELKCGAEVEPHAVHAAQFTLDKRKYSIRFSDETEDSMKVWIERKEGSPVTQN